MKTEVNMQDMIFEYIDQIIELLSPEIWKNVLLNCSKNELLTIWLVYRKQEVNMTNIAEYIHVPLNTATGIVSRLEKKDYIIRNRSKEDKRIVTIQLGEEGKKHMDEIMQICTRYFTRIVESVSIEEFGSLFHIMDVMKKIMLEEQTKEQKKKIVKKITIE